MATCGQLLQITIALQVFPIPNKENFVPYFWLEDLPGPDFALLLILVFLVLSFKFWILPFT